jgi:hypothetical protein
MKKSTNEFNKSYENKLNLLERLSGKSFEHLNLELEEIQEFLKEYETPKEERFKKVTSFSSWALDPRITLVSWRYKLLDNTTPVVVEQKMQINAFRTWYDKIQQREKFSLLSVTCKKAKEVNAVSRDGDETIIERVELEERDVFLYFDKKEILIKGILYSKDKGKTRRELKRFQLSPDHVAKLWIQLEIYMSEEVQKPFLEYFKAVDRLRDIDTSF